MGSAFWDQGPAVRQSKKWVSPAPQGSVLDALASPAPECCAGTVYLSVKKFIPKNVSVAQATVYLKVFFFFCL